MATPTPRLTPARRASVAALAVVCGLAVACGGGDGGRESGRKATSTTEESVLGVTVTRGDQTDPAEPVTVPTTAPSTTAAAPTPAPTTATTVRRPPTTAPATTTTAAPTTSTSRASRPNTVGGSYAASGTNPVTVELQSNGGVFDARSLPGGGDFEFANLPDGVYRIVITETIPDDDPSDGNDTSSQVVSGSDTFALTDGDTAFVSCTSSAGCETSLANG